MGDGMTWEQYEARVVKPMLGAWRVGPHPHDCALWPISLRLKAHTRRVDRLHRLMKAEAMSRPVSVVISPADSQRVLPLSVG